MTEEIQQPSTMASIMENFSHSGAGGEDEILRIASNYALQISGRQIRTLMMLKLIAITKKDKPIAKDIETFIKEYLEVKHHHESGMFIMRVIDSLAIKKLVTENTARVNVMKQ